MMTKEFIKEVMSIPSCSGHEQMMRSYVLDFAAARGIGTLTDAKGNVYLTKGAPLPGEKYVCLTWTRSTTTSARRPRAVAS